MMLLSGARGNARFDPFRQRCASQSQHSHSTSTPMPIDRDGGGDTVMSDRFGPTAKCSEDCSPPPHSKKKKKKTGKTDKTGVAKKRVHWLQTATTNLNLLEGVGPVDDVPEPPILTQREVPSPIQHPTGVAAE